MKTSVNQSLKSFRQKLTPFDFFNQLSDPYESMIFDRKNFKQPLFELSRAFGIQERIINYESLTSPAYLGNKLRTFIK